jgi:feruloyl esterase
MHSDLSSWLRRVGCAVALALLSARSHAAEPLAEACAKLTALAGPHFMVREARFTPAGIAPGMSKAFVEPVRLPDHCLFRGTLWPRKGADGRLYGIRFELRMPRNWNGRFLFEGGAGSDGLEFPAYGTFGSGNRVQPPAVAKGFAVVRTDSGHQSEQFDDREWSADQQARIDFAYNAVDKVTLKAKEVIEAYYGRKIDYSYFIGCSNGGRQGMLVTQRMPLYFDGVVAGNAAFRGDMSHLRAVWGLSVLSRISPRDEDGRPIVSKAFSHTDLKLVADAALKSCDALDGLADGMINDIKACHFDPAILTCKSGKTDSCLTQDQVTALKTLIEGPRDRKGQPLFGSFPYDTGIETHFAEVYLGTSPTSKANGWAATEMLGDVLNGMTPPDPQFDPYNMDFLDTWDRIQPYATTARADSTFLETFARRGKLIIFNGNSDYILSSNDIARWYDRLEQDTGGHTEDWARLFLVPGMKHCSHGLATDQFDPLASVQEWVEKGTPPDRIIATGTSFPGVTRPLCAWPKVARYVKGDPKNAQSFECRS